jgi:hypothetical protein
MFGIDTGRVPTQVVELEPVGDAAYEGLVRNAVGHAQLALDLHTAIPTQAGAVIDPRCPHPAAGVVIDPPVGEKAILQSTPNNESLAGQRPSAP